nr:hypothetical protein CFP56_53754 [Quercus suber]
MPPHGKNIGITPNNSGNGRNQQDENQDFRHDQGQPPEMIQMMQTLVGVVQQQVTTGDNLARMMEQRRGHHGGMIKFKRAVVSKALLVEMGLNEALADRDNNQKKRLGKERSSCFQSKKQGTQHADTKALPKCSRCGRPYVDKDCHWNTGACFSYGQRGHRIAECPQWKKV